MAVLKPRNRILVLRLSQEEYEALRTVSLSRGARNLSDFTRSALLAAVATGDANGAESLGDVCRAVSTLQELVGRMAETLDLIARKEIPLAKVKKA
jgi:hypothetical protein